MEALGAVSTLLTIVTEFSRMYKELRKLAKTLKHARDNIKSMANEVQIFADLMLLFHGTITDVRLGDEGLSGKIQTSKLVAMISRSGNEALEKIEDILETVKPLRGNTTSSLLAQCIARWKWYNRKDEWMPIQVSLNSIKESANLLISMVRLQDLVHQIKELGAAQTTIPDGIKIKLSV